MRKFIAAVLVAGTIFVAAPATASAAPVVTASPCAGKSMPSIFKYGPSGWSQFFWWFATGCK